MIHTHINAEYASDMTQGGLSRYNVGEGWCHAKLTFTHLYEVCV